MFSVPDLQKTEENRCFRPQAGAWPKLPQTSRARNIFSHFWATSGQNLTKVDQAGMSKFWGLLFFWRKNRRRPPGSEAQSLMVRTFQDFKGFKGFQKLSDAQSPRGSSPRFSHACLSCGKSLQPFPAAQSLARMVRVRVFPMPFFWRQKKTLSLFPAPKAWFDS